MPLPARRRVLALLAHSLIVPMTTGTAGIAGTAAYAQGGPTLAVSRPQRPLNVLVILADQHNARALSSYDNGYGGVAQPLTPNIDRLANEGVKFTNAFCTTPQCSPSRYSILTGRETHRHGLRWNGIWEPRGPAAFPELFRDAGYATATIGKHHMMWLDQPEPLVEDYGFERVLDYDHYRAYCLENLKEVYSGGGNFWQMVGLPAILFATGFTFNSNDFHPAGYFAGEVMQFLDERAGPGGDGRPFLCFYSFYSPHTPLLPSGPADPNDFAHRFPPGTLALAPSVGIVAATTRLAQRQALFASISPGEWAEILSYYYGLIAQVDFNVGRVLDHLDALGLSENTLVLYTSDHGEMATELGCWEKAAGSYDALTRVPLLMRLPGVLPAGAELDLLTSNVDLFPTLVELAAVPMADDVRAGLDGESLLDVVLRGEGSVPWRAEVFSEFGFTQPNIRRQRMVRTKAAKYVVDELGGGEEELFDLVADPFEMLNLAGDPAPAVQATLSDLRGRLDGWWNSEVGHAPHYLVSGEATDLPARAEAPVPRNAQTGVARDVDPTWVPSTGAERQLVHFGKDPQALPHVATLDGMVASYNPGTLSPDVAYFWRVDSLNANGTRTGPLWAFVTTPRGSGGPRLAFAPAPAHGVAPVALGTQLAWQIDPGVVAQELFLGPAGALASVGPIPIAVTTYAPPPGALRAGVEYEWRVDTLNAQGRTVGDVWRFRVDPTTLPATADVVWPPHLGAIVGGAPVTLQWAPGVGATSHEVYLGTSFPLAFLGRSPVPWIGVGSLPVGTHYWRVDEVGVDGTRLGATWRFAVE